jgi:alpha-glucuronidase
MMKSSLARRLGLAALALLSPAWAEAEDGYDLWLRYRPITEAATRDAYRSVVRSVLVEGRSPTAEATRAELLRGLRGLLGGDVREVVKIEASTLVVGTPATSTRVAALGWQKELEALGPEGYVIRQATVDSKPVTVIASTGEIGALYGAFHLLRLVQTEAPLEPLFLTEKPRMALRLLNHWDNLDGSIERGYAGKSLWDWQALPGKVDPRVIDYARANASLGINGTVLNNVNASPQSLSRSFLEKAAALAKALRPYGIRVYLSANFASPKVIGGLPTADPKDPAVARFWKDKAAEVYSLIPDFGGLLVKANSEGQPGPQDYGRNHGDGANVLAEAFAPHGGIIMWRAFVYASGVDADRTKRASLEFVPLDGKLHPNVLVQVKNGPLDFMPREPFHPLFGAVPKTPLLAELQITQEYLGQQVHLAYLAPMWKEFLDSETFVQGPGSTVARIVDGSLEGHRRTGMAGVANTGDDRNWCGHDLAQANWHAYGRLAWDPSLSSEALAEEWIRMTFGGDPKLLATIRSMLLDSREAIVDYSMPLGLHHLIGGDHYAPMPENDDPRRDDWSAIYYHRADKKGVGFDRTRTGSGAVDQYARPLADTWNDPLMCPENLLLWFHRRPWDSKLASGQTLWEGIVAHYYRGAERAAAFEKEWASLEGKVDAERHKAVAARLRRQAEEAGAWRDKCLAYFQKFSGLPITAPAGPPKP